MSRKVGSLGCGALACKLTWLVVLLVGGLENPEVNSQFFYLDSNNFASQDRGELQLCLILNARTDSPESGAWQKVLLRRRRLWR